MGVARTGQKLAPAGKHVADVHFGSGTDTLRTSADVRFTPKSGLRRHGSDVRFVPKADIKNIFDQPC